MTNPQLKLAVEDFEVEYELVPMEVDERRIAIYKGLNKIEEMLEVNLQKIEELNSDIDRLTNHADGLDYTVAVASGVITSLIDSFFGEEIKKITDKFINNKVIEGAKKEKIKESIRKAEEQAKEKGQKLSEEAKQSIKNKIENEFSTKNKNADEEKKILSKAIRYLEKHKQSPTDKIWNYQGSKVTPESHHLDDLSHHASIIGLVASIITQFTRAGYFFDSDGNKTKIPIVIDEKNKELFGTTVKAKIVCGTLNWFWHLVSDVAGTSGKNAGAGMGVPGSLMSLVKSVASLPGIRNTNLPELANKMFKDLKFDFRKEVAQSVPVMLNEIFVRVFYSIRRFVSEYKEHKNLTDIDWKKVMPFNNRTVTRMLTIATGTFTAVDLADAAIRSAIESGGFNAITITDFMLKVNIVGVGKFAVSVSNDVKMGIQRSLKRRERINLYSEQIYLLNAKVFYYQANMWISAEETAQAMEVLYDTAEKSIICFCECVEETRKNAVTISTGLKKAEEKNPGISDKIANMLLWG